MNSSMSEYTSGKHVRTHANKTQRTVVQWENPLAVQYHISYSLLPTHYIDTEFSYVAQEQEELCSVVCMVC